jgi:hypothetical protein
MHMLNCLIQGEEYFEKKGASTIAKQQDINEHPDSKTKSPLLQVLNMLKH